MFVPKKNRPVPVINVMALPLDPLSNLSTSEGEVSMAKECQDYSLQISSISCPPTLSPPCIFSSRPRQAGKSEQEGKKENSDGRQKLICSVATFSD